MRPLLFVSCSLEKAMLLTVTVAAMCSFSRSFVPYTAFTSRAPLICKESQLNFPHDNTAKISQVFSTTRLPMWNNDNDNRIYGRDRITSCIPYVLPLLDGDQFGKYVYMRIPPLHAIDRVLLGPLLEIYHSIPFFGLGVFLLLSFGSRNTNLSRSVRFNMQQAVLIDIALIFPELFGSLTNVGGGLPQFLVEPSTNFVYYTFISCVLYSIVSNISGKKPNEIPWISQAAEMSIGPF
mmetsp:Transcript_6158/g.8989  ORF Transcript_6158/g.8989 Transcript_6158/m.8989 type:complete len:236 (+) Transcript_6158:160-867(+)